MARELDELVDDFRNRPLDRGPYTYVWADALFLKVREGGRVVNVALLLAVGVNGDGYREILGLELSTAEDGAGWLAFGADRPWFLQCATGHLRRPSGTGRSHSRHPVWSVLAEMSAPLSEEPADQSPQIG